MKLKIRYDDTFQTIDLDEQSAQQLWVSLSLDEGEGLSETEREEKIQEAFDREYNRPEYNSWYKFDRHTDPNPKCKKMNGKKGYIQAEPGDEAFDIMDYLQVTEDDHSSLEYQDTCDWIRKAIGKKQNWADAFIAVYLDEMSVNDYAASIGVGDASIVSKYLTRAKKKLKEKYAERQI